MISLLLGNVDYCSLKYMGGQQRGRDYSWVTPQGPLTGSDPIRKSLGDYSFSICS
jgi:hypothetical protein